MKSRRRAGSSAATKCNSTCPKPCDKNYRQLLVADRYPPCYQIIPSLSPIIVHSWLSALQTERLEQKTEAIRQRVGCAAAQYGDRRISRPRHGIRLWHQRRRFRAMGLEPFRFLPSVTIVTTFFRWRRFSWGKPDFSTSKPFPRAIPRRSPERGLFRPTSQRISLSATKILTAAHRPRNFGDSCACDTRRYHAYPHPQLAFFYQQTASLSQIVHCQSVEELENALDTCATAYWQTHFLFGAASPKNKKRLSPASRRLIVINTVVPLFSPTVAIATTEVLCDRAFSLLEVAQNTTASPE